ncbi:MAG: thiamine pyrophosphate-binding protein [Dehalococcoidales bacterium]|nr:thiamine pyrophosphate-binding protein [Dehalococcoidales bacterium]
MTDIRGHELIAQTLKKLGAKHVYSVPGGPVTEVLVSCIKAGVRVIGVRNEQSGVMMAVAENYVAGHCAGVPVLASGPGVTNGVTGTLIARDNCWPLVVLGGRQAITYTGMGIFQELDGTPIFESITKWSAVLQTTARIPEFLARAYQIATSGQPGPVYLDLPMETINGVADADKVKPAEPLRPSPSLGDPDAVREAAELLLKAERPLLLIGKGVRWSEPYAELKQLVESLNLPFVASPMGRGSIPDDHPLNFNATRNLAIKNADVVLLAGVRLNWMFKLGSDFAPSAKLIQIDIEPKEIGRNRAATVGIVGDIKQVLMQILAETRGKKKAMTDRSAWVSSLQAKREANERNLVAFTDSDAVPMTTHRMIKEIRDFIPRDAICVVDGQLVLAAGRQALPSYVPASRLNSGTNGCMGQGVPFGIGAKLAAPDRMVVSICGDCSFGFSAMEMETAVRQNIPVIFIVEENEGIQGALFQDMSMPKNHPERVTTYQPDIHYELIMKAFGGHTEYVKRPDELRPALERAAASGKAACINVKTDPRTPFPGPDGRPHHSGITMSY